MGHRRITDEWVKNSMENGYYRLYAYDKKENKSTKLLMDYDDAKTVIEATGDRWSGIITNQLDGKKLKIRTASCGLPHCMCMLKVVKEIV